VRCLAAISLLALAGCSGGEPDYIALICLEDLNQRHIVESDYIKLFERNGYSFERYKYGVGLNASKFLGANAHINFSSEPWEPGRPMRIVVMLTTNGDEQLSAKFKELTESKWGGFQEPDRAFRGDECVVRQPAGDLK
jgi:hypothetical protein